MIDKLSWITVYPELILLGMACVIALVDLSVTSARRGLTYVLTLATLAVVAFVQARYALEGETVYGFGNMVVSDAMGNWLKCFAASPRSSASSMVALTRVTVDAARR